MVSVVNSLLDSLEDLAVIWEVEWLEHKGERGVVAAHSLNWRLQVVERTLLDCRGELGSETTGEGCLVRDDALARLLNRVDYRLAVPGNNRAQINDFTGDADLLGPANSHAYLAQLHSIADNRDVGALLHNLGLAKRNFIVFNGHVFLGDSVQNLGLEEQAGVVRANAGEKQSLCLHWGPRDRNFEAGGVRKVSLW